MAVDPYLYPGTNVLINKENIRERDGLEQFERVMTGLRLGEGLPKVPLTVAGYRALHRHVFQDVYDWAGEFRTVDISKGGHLFCRATFIGSEMDKRFAAIKAQGSWKGLPEPEFVARIADHISELNAIHPFREGNGRTMRAFLKVAGRAAGHEVHIEHIDPAAWAVVSRESFVSANTAGMRAVIGAITGPMPERGGGPERKRDRSKGYER